MFFIIKDGVYYKVDASESTGQGAYNYTYYIFNLEENTLTEIYSNGSPFEAADGGMHDQCCYDAVINSKDKGKKSLVERMNSRHGIHIVEAGQQHNLGTRNYELVSLD